MAKIIGIDYGTKRVGLAETDDLQIIASALTTVSTAEIFKFLDEYCSKNSVEAAVIGLPVRSNGELNEVEEDILKFITKFSNKYPKIRIERINEAFTSKLAMQAMIQAGAGKKKRREKGNLDKISATLILQQYLENKRNILRHERK